MAKVLIICEMKGADPKKVTLELLSKGGELARELGGDVAALAIGSGLEGLADKLGPYGASRVLVAEGVDRYNTEGYAEIVARAVKEEDPSVILFGATAMGKDLAPRLAARIDAGIVADCVDVSLREGRVVARHPVFAGKAFIDVVFNASPAVVSLRPNSVSVGEPSGAGAEMVSVSADFGPVKARVTAEEAGESARPDLTEAERIVSGGRAMKSAENFKILEEMADVIGATVGASRAAVDSDFAPQSMQVGQTGKTVNPSLYIACGISGAIQHLAGMRTSKVIVAINKDPEAPIFQKADYGIVADLFEAVPVMTEEFKKILADT